MTAWKSAFATLMLVGWLSATASAQSRTPATRPVPEGATGAYPAGQGGAGLTQFYGMTPNFANYGLSGTYPNYGGYGYAGYGPGAQFGAHYPGSTAPNDRPKPARPAPTPARKPSTATAPRKGL